jgi:hypothetical protein
VNPAWREEAPCAADPDLWFSDLRSNDTARARAVCAGCPVRYDCLDYAVRLRPADGIWAGLDCNQLADAYGDIHVCGHCGALFATVNRRVWYCTDECRKAERRVQQARSAKKRTTPHRKTAAA